ncbi:hypothetical protein Mal64_12880 [Pseudobythopirellula maris]|uniref:Uncharacterized protein n=1 Tax=Pseudobythopirellula maris TaxID=2527991 RepID=A0A5C5ZUK9_9BACT|nr:hypothetical protein [Pseudobythopirellula maris]TWT90890.1 hypothetical protein Mal64_12880 [Pseudobythopirellula maris]
MRTGAVILIAILLGVAGVASPFAARAAAPEASSAPAGADAGLIAELVEELGHPRYANRQAAAMRLERMGLRAFDPLVGAAEHPDPEIAAAARRLLGKIGVRWNRLEDPPQVRTILSQYGDATPKKRTYLVAQLTTLLPESADALCRVARYDLDPRVSRDAALSLLTDRGGLRDGASEGRLIEAVRAANRRLTEDFGPSQRPAAGWIAIALASRDAPAIAAPLWGDAIAAEREVLALGDTTTNASIVQRLLWLRFDAAARAWTTSGGDAAGAEVDRALDAILEFEPDNRLPLLQVALARLADAGAWGPVDRALERHAALLDSKRGGYIAARLRLREGRTDDAERLAEAALAQPPDDDEAKLLDGVVLFDARTLIGKGLEDEGLSDWARREFASAVADWEELPANAAYAAMLLAESLADDARYAEAAEALAPLVDSLSAGDERAKRYRRLREATGGRLTLPSPEFLAGRGRYFAGLAARERGDHEAEVAALRSALEHEPADADALIALYRAAKPLADDTVPEDGATDQDEELLAETRKLIREMMREFEEAIEQNPNNATPYNQWAWLVANTEGDYDKAVRYSRHSLRLSPGDAGYLDTLARCLYAAGDLEAAIVAQSRAIAKEPHLGVMQRQLEFFQNQRDGR